MRRAIMGILLGIFLLVLMTNVYAVSCMSDVQCPNGGAERCRVDGNNHYLEVYRCANSECQSSITKVVECCPPDVGCAVDQTCDSQHGFKCVGGTPDTPIDQTDGSPNGQDNDAYSGITIGIIIAVGVIIGFIILAIILKKK